MKNEKAQRYSLCFFLYIVNMKLIKYGDLDKADNFLNFLFSETILEKNELLYNNFMDKLQMHKIFVEKYNSILTSLETLTAILIKYSNISAESKIINLFTIASLSVCILEEGKFLKSNGFNKNTYEIEIKSILEELKMSGIGNGLVKSLSEIFKSIFNMSKIVFRSNNIYNSFNEPNLLKSIILYINRYKLNINNFNSNFDGLIDTIHRHYVKTGKLDGIKAKILQKSQTTDTKVFSINEINL